MILKYAFRHFSRRPFANFLLIIQMIVIHLVCIAMVSSIVSRADEYTPFSDLLRGEGDYYIITNGLNPETGIAGFGAEEIEAALKGDSKVTCSYNPWAQVWYCDSWNSASFQTITYDDAFIQAYHPRLSAGEWIDPEKDYGGLIPIVVSENLGYAVGDELTYTVDDNTPLQAIIVGILQDGAKILAPVSSNGEPPTVHYFYTNYYAEFEEKFLILAAEGLFMTDFAGQPNGILIVQYPNGISEEDHAYNDAFLRRIGCLTSCDLPSLRKNTKAYIYDQCLTLLPIAVSVVILAITSILSMSALATKRQIRDYAVYSLCGLPWKQCIRIQVSEMLISTFAALILTWCGLLLCKPLYQNTVIRAGIWQMLGSLGVTVFCLITATLIPLQLFRKHTTKSILQESER